MTFTKDHGIQVRSGESKDKEDGEHWEDRGLKGLAGSKNCWVHVSQWERAGGKGGGGGV